MPAAAGPRFAFSFHENLVGRLPALDMSIEAIGGRGMFFFYFNKLGWTGSVLVSIVLTLLLVLAFQVVSG
jgi:hypothetical protein